MKILLLRLFAYRGHLFQASFETGTDWVEVQDTALRNQLRMASAASLLVALICLALMYRAPQQGIQVGPLRAIILWDAIILLFGIPFSWWCLDILLVHLFAVNSWWGDDPMLGMGVFWMALANPFLSLFVTATAAQSVAIDAHGITSSGLFGRKQVAWTDVTGIEVANLYTPKGAGTMTAAKKTARHLLIHGNNTTLRILEPPYNSTKQLLLSQLQQHAPTEFHDALAAAKNHWMAYW